MSKEINMLYSVCDAVMCVASEQNEWKGSSVWFRASRTWSACSRSFCAQICRYDDRRFFSRFFVGMFEQWKLQFLFICCFVSKGVWYQMNQKKEKNACEVSEEWIKSEYNKANRIWRWNKTNKKNRLIFIQYIAPIWYGYLNQIHQIRSNRFNTANSE